MASLNFPDSPSDGDIYTANDTLWIYDGGLGKWRAGGQPGSAAGEIVPVGSVFWFAAAAAPGGYFECDGTAVSRTTYSDLFDEIGTVWGVGDGSTTFNLPDLRGEFVRGWDNGKGTDSGRSFGSFQDEEVGSHLHNIDTGSDNSAGSADGTPFASASAADEVYDTDLNSGTETRPRNFAMLPCIKYAPGISYDLNQNASQAEAEAGTSNTVVMTPLRTEQWKDNTIASQAQAEAGANNTELMTPLRTKQAIDQLAPLLTNVYTSTAQTITTAGLLTLAHSLGSIPLVLQAYVKCTTTNAGYAVGDEVVVAVGNNSSSGGTRANGVYIDATNINIRFSSNSTCYLVGNKTTGSGTGLNNSSWNLYILAWA